MPEPDGANSQGFGPIGPINANVDIKLPEIESAARSVALLTTQLDALKRVLNNFSSLSGNSLNNVLKQIKENATAASGAVNGLTGSVASGSTGGGGSGTAGGGGGASGWAAQATSQAANAVASRLPGGIAAAGEYLKGADSLGGGMVMGGLRFLRDRIATSRNLAIQSGSELGMVSRQQGLLPGQSRIEDMMKTMSRFPGSVMGTSQDLLDLFSSAPMYGASYNFGGQAGGQGRRAQGFFAGVREAQMLNPGESVGNIVQNVGGFAANTKAQQQSVMMTGGAYSMIGAGGRQKSISEWAEGVLKWLEGLRPGKLRGTPFNYGDLMGQYFPGSNIDAWFDANAVPQNMRNYWWTYALQKASKGNPSDFKIGEDTTNVAWTRLQATSQLTGTEFNLGGQMMGAFVNKEQSNKWFNSLLGSITTTLIPAFANSIGKFVEYLPDTLEDLLMSGIEGIAAGDAAGDTAWVGDPDVGDQRPQSGYGKLGGTSLSGLSPNMRSKLAPMMKANPKLRINSGLRDNAMQKRLKDQGYSRVSGKPSAHTRGDAADLGPSSQYGWIMKNAKRFGLQSGASQGEPWHVGVGDSAYDKFTDVLSGLSGGASGLVDIVQWFLGGLLQKFSGLMGGGSADTSTTALTETSGQDFFQQLVDASKGGITVGGKFGGLPSKATPSSTSSSDQRVQDVIDRNTGGIGAGGFGVQPGPGTTRQMLGIQAAQAAYAAGFRGQDLITAVAISGRESAGWNPNAYNGNAATGDKSYGLMQINMLGSLGEARRKKYHLGSNEELLDPYKNMEVAYDMAYSRSTPFYDWGPYKKMPATYSTNVNEAAEIARMAGVGDVQQMQYANMTPDARTSNTLQFNNTFNLGGGAGGMSGGGGGIDVRYTVTRVADLLEDEMNRRLARTN